jgi:hypothetical protein
MFRVEINKELGFIRIFRNDEEVLYWDESEWIEDSEVVFQIANAIDMALTNPEEMDKKLRILGKIT